MKRLAVCQRVICWGPSLTSGQTSDTLMLLVCVEVQLSNHPSFVSPLCAYFLRFALPFSVVPSLFLFSSDLFFYVLFMVLCNVKIGFADY